MHYTGKVSTMWIVFESLYIFHFVNSMGNYNMVFKKNVPIFQFNKKLDKLAKENEGYEQEKNILLVDIGKLDLEATVSFKAYIINITSFL